MSARQCPNKKKSKRRCAKWLSGAETLISNGMKQRISGTRENTRESRLNLLRWSLKMKTALIRLDRIDEKGEQRWHAIGSLYIGSTVSVVLLVAFVFRKDNGGEEIVRIISARRAEKHEIRRYQEQAMQ